MSFNPQKFISLISLGRVKPFDSSDTQRKSNALSALSALHPAPNSFNLLINEMRTNPQSIFVKKGNSSSSLEFKPAYFEKFNSIYSKLQALISIATLFSNKRYNITEVCRDINTVNITPEDTFFIQELLSLASNNYLTKKNTSFGSRLTSFSLKRGKSKRTSSFTTKKWVVNFNNKEIKLSDSTNILLSKFYDSISSLESQSSNVHALTGFMSLLEPSIHTEIPRLPTIQYSTDDFSQLKTGKTLVMDSETYTFKNELGTGNFGKVFKANDSRGNPVAIKVLVGRINEQDLLKECTTQSRVASFFPSQDKKHPKALSVHGVLKDPHNHYLVVMDLGKGTPPNNMASEEYSLFREQLLSAISHMHQQGYVHLDLKPENMLWDQDSNQLTLLDFGNCTQSSDTEFLKKIGGIKATRLFIAPGDQQKIPCYHDSFAVGVTLLYALYGQTAINDQLKQEGIKDPTRTNIAFTVRNATEDEVKDYLGNDCLPEEGKIYRTSDVQILWLKIIKNLLETDIHDKCSQELAYIESLLKRQCDVSGLSYGNIKSTDEVIDVAIGLQSPRNRRRSSGMRFSGLMSPTSSLRPQNPRKLNDPLPQSPSIRTPDGRAQASIFFRSHKPEQYLAANINDDKRIPQLTRLNDETSVSKCEDFLRYGCKSILNLSETNISQLLAGDDCHQKQKDLEFISKNFKKAFGHLKVDDIHNIALFANFDRILHLLSTFYAIKTNSQQTLQRARAQVASSVTDSGGGIGSSLERQVPPITLPPSPITSRSASPTPTTISVKERARQYEQFNKQS